MNSVSHTYSYEPISAYLAKWKGTSQTNKSIPTPSRRAMGVSRKGDVNGDAYRWNLLSSLLTRHPCLGEGHAAPPSSDFSPHSQLHTKDKPLTTTQLSSLSRARCTILFLIVSTALRPSQAVSVTTSSGFFSHRMCSLAGHLVKQRKRFRWLASKEGIFYRASRLSPTMCLVSMNKMETGFICVKSTVQCGNKLNT